MRCPFRPPSAWPCVCVVFSFSLPRGSRATPERVYEQSAHVLNAGMQCVSWGHAPACSSELETGPFNFVEDFMASPAGGVNNIVRDVRNSAEQQVSGEAATKCRDISV